MQIERDTWGLLQQDTKYNVITGTEKLHLIHHYEDGYLIGKENQLAYELGSFYEKNA